MLALSTPSIMSNQSNFGSTTITVTSLSNFQGAVALSCSGLPANATCIFNPGSLTFYAQGTTVNPALQTVLQIRVGQTPVQVVDPVAPSSLGLIGMLSATLLVLFVRLRTAGARLKLMSVVTLLALGGVLGLSGCGSSSVSAFATPAGSYTVTINATATPSLPQEAAANSARNVSTQTTVSLVVQ
jgi:hypothetical protein